MTSATREQVQRSESKPAFRAPASKIRSSRSKSSIDNRGSGPGCGRAASAASPPSRQARFQAFTPDSEAPQAAATAKFPWPKANIRAATRRRASSASALPVGLMQPVRSRQPLRSYSYLAAQQSIVVQCYEIVGANAAQLRLKHVSAAVSSVPSGPHSVHEVSGELLSTLRFTIQPDGMTAKAVLPERYEGNGAISADLTIRAISASGAPIDINAKGRTLPPRETIRAYPYLWVLIRRQWSG